MADSVKITGGLSDRLIVFEANELPVAEIPDFFCELANTGLINHLDGWYGRFLADLIRNGIIDVKPADGGGTAYSVNQDALDKLL